MRTVPSVSTSHFASFCHILEPMCFPITHIFPYSPFFFLFRATPTTYGGSQTRSQIGAVPYTTATATRDLSCICDPHHSSRQHWIPNPLSEARDWTRNLIVPSRIHFHCTTTGTPYIPPPFFLVFLSFRAAPAAYGGSQARGQIRAVVACLHHSHSNTGSLIH